MTFDFANAEAYSGGGILGRGGHHVQIMSARMGTSSGGHPEIQLEMENDEGGIRDWRVITPQSIGWVVGLTDAAGLPRPTPEDVADAETGRLTDEYVAQLVKRWVRITVKEEPNRNDPTKMRNVVAGYRPSDGQPVAAGTSAAKAPDFPF